MVPGARPSDDATAPVFRLADGLASVPGPLTPGDCRMGDGLHPPQATFIPRRGLRGRIDEFAIWRRALTRDEVQALFVAGLPTLPAGE